MKDSLGLESVTNTSSQKYRQKNDLVTNENTFDAMKMKII